MFKASCDKHQQEVTYCAVGSHWQNGLAECFIGIVTQTARTLLLHAMAQWPTVVNKEFWPFAICHACTFHNELVHPDLNKSPHHLFTGSPALWKLDDFHVFGCPVFIQDKRLQDGDSLPKWKACSWLGVYIGHSLQHAGNVPVVYNPLTTHISPQFHVIYDDQISTNNGDPATLTESLFQSLHDKSEWMYTNYLDQPSNIYTF